MFHDLSIITDEWSKEEKCFLWKHYENFYGVIADWEIFELNDPSQFPSLQSSFLSDLVYDKPLEILILKCHQLEYTNSNSMNLYKRFFRMKAQFKD